jgi:thiol:disulfide interchange protein
MMTHRFRQFGRRGISLSEGLLYGLILMVVLLGGFAVFRSVTIQHRVASTFTGWYEDKAGYEKAQADMKATGKPMLVYFYATWCPHCKRFTAYVLSDPKMQNFVKSYPHVRIAPDNGKTEQALMSEYGAQGYPAFYVVKPDGQRTQIDTYAEKPRPHPKTPAEFIESVQTVIDGK